MISPLVALDRTARLTTTDIFRKLDATDVVTGLVQTRVCIRADSTTTASAAGQTAVISAAILSAQLGAQIYLDIPDTPVLSHQPPLEPGGSLRDHLHEHLERLITPPARRDAPSDLELLFGSAATGGNTDVTMPLTGDGWGYSCTLDGRRARPWSGSAPFGGLSAGAAAAAEVYRTALRNLGDRHGVVYRGEHHLDPRASAMTLRPVGIAVDVGTVDLISAGAINQCVLFALGRLPPLIGHCRAIEFDVFDGTNLNRYPLATSDDIGSPKADVATVAASDGFAIRPAHTRLEVATVAALSPFAEHMLVGTDRIDARWDAQHNAPGWVWVGGTSHFGGYVWTHPPGEPCAGCANPRDGETADPGPIPTISFVSSLTGTLLAYEFLAALDGTQPQDQRALAVSPFNLAGSSALYRDQLRANPRCPVGCPASSATAP